MNIETKRRACRFYAVLFLLLAAFWLIAVPVLVYVFLQEMPAR